MHELSIAENLVSLAVSAIRADAESADAIPTVAEVCLRVGRLAAVEKDSLRFCYEVVIDGTPLAGSRLVIEELPVVIFCDECQKEQELPGIQSLQCPTCGRPSGDVRQGRELELATILLNDRPTPVTN